MKKLFYFLIGATISVGLAYGQTVNPLPYLIRITNQDTTPGYLFSKLVAGSNITLTKNNPGANETITISSTGGSGGTFATTSINGVATTSFTFATGTDPNIDLIISTSTGTLTFTPAWKSFLSILKGGTGTTTLPAFGQLLMGNASGGYDLVATSSLGISSGSTPGGTSTQLQFNDSGTFGGAFLDYTFDMGGNSNILTAETDGTGLGGAIRIFGGNGINNLGGSLQLMGGTGDGVYNGGSIDFAAGTGGNTFPANGGSLSFFGGHAGAGSDGNGGNVIFGGGDKDGSGLFGRVSIETGPDYFDAFLDSSNLTGIQEFLFPDQSGTFALIEDLASYVPYTGATTDVDLGGNFLKFNSYVDIYGFDTDKLGINRGSDGTAGVLDLTGLTTDRTFTFPDVNGTFALGTGTMGNCATWSSTNELTDTGSPCGGSGASPGGVNMDIQFNDSGSFGGDSSFTFDKTDKGLTYSATGDDSYLYTYVESADASQWSEFGMFGTGSPQAEITTSNGLFHLREGVTYQSAILDFSDIASTDKTFTFPNSSGTFCLTSTCFSGSFADAETPAGTVNGSNAVFTLAHTPSGASLQLFVNGQYMASGGVDYTLSTATITFVVAPPTSSIIRAHYRY